MPDIGDTAPAFTATDQNGASRSLTDYRGSWLLLYFYPKDDTPGCTTEACSFRDNLDALQNRGVAVVGVSTDDTASHRAFSEKYALNFPILPDPDKTIVHAYDATEEKTLYGKLVRSTHRMSFLISPEGRIEKIYRHVKPDEHVAEVLHDVEHLTR